MTKSLFNSLAILSTAFIGTSCLASSTVENKTDDFINDVDEFEDVVPIEMIEKEWKCPDCNFNEQYVLAELQENTQITDRNALATIMGNIKQESKFFPNICEGGARVPYDKCYIGGYGLIQWTTLSRYKGLGDFCEKYDCDPSSLEGQTRYMINEDIFQNNLPMFEGSGLAVSEYMTPAYYWLGWGIEGDRRQYSYDYTKKFVWA